jgi:voltage-gated potassium channel
MFSLGFALLRLWQGFTRGFSDTRLRALLLVLFVTMLGGTSFYPNVEGWSWVDPIYYSVMTLATASPDGFRLTSDFAQTLHGCLRDRGLGVMLSFALLLASYITGMQGLVTKEPFPKASADSIEKD